MKISYSILILISFILTRILAFGASVEEYKYMLDTAQTDTMKVKLYEQLTWAHIFTEPETAQLYADSGLELATKINYRKGLASIYSDLGIMNDVHNNYTDALKYYHLALDIDIEMNNVKGQARIYNNIGIFYKNRGELDQALEYFIKSLKIKEKIGERKGISASNLGIGNIYYNLEDYQSALKYYMDSYVIDEEIDNFDSKSISANNVGLACYELGMLDTAKYYYAIALAAADSSNNLRSKSNCYNNLGLLHMNVKEYATAEEYYKKSYQIDTALRDTSSMIASVLNLGTLFTRWDDPAKAISYLNTGLDLAIKIEYLYGQKNAYEMLASQYALIGQYEKGYTFQEKFIQLKDSLAGLENEETINNLNAKYESEKKELQIDNLNKANALKQAELERSEEKRSKQLILIYSFVAGFMVIIVFSLIIFRLYLQKKKANNIILEKNSLLEMANEEILTQKEEIEAQRDQVNDQKEHIEELYEITKEGKAMVEAQKKEIEDSIHYAKRIQTALISAGVSLSSFETFIFFKPKDVVSGDFYWSTEVDGWNVITVVDSTGHGVPGAFMSMLGISFLNEIVRNKKVTDPAEILNQMRTALINALSAKIASESQVKDGFDMSIISICKKDRKALWAGANNPVYLLHDGEILEIKGDKMPVAHYTHMTDFTNHEINLEEGDSIYLFTDGFPDQFGGPKGKKYKYKPFKKLLQDNTEQSMARQKIILEEELNNWMGELEQIDDITVVGIKI